MAAREWIPQTELDVWSGEPVPCRIWARKKFGRHLSGLNPSPDLYDGVLVRVPIEALAELLSASVARLLALNEVFVGHRSHQSARYNIAAGDAQEERSSSGLIVASGTGATGWARSIMEATGAHLSLGTEERAVGYSVREPFPSIATGTSMRCGKLAVKPHSQ